VSNHELLPSCERHCSLLSTMSSLVFWSHHKYRTDEGGVKGPTFKVDWETIVQAWTFSQESY
jgi:hypothetical protein